MNALVFHKKFYTTLEFQKKKTLFNASSEEWMRFFQTMYKRN